MKEQIAALQGQISTHDNEVKEILIRLDVSMLNAAQLGDQLARHQQEAADLRRALFEECETRKQLSRMIEDLMESERVLRDRLGNERDRRDRGWESWHVSGRKKKHPPGIGCVFM